MAGASTVAALIVEADAGEVGAIDLGSAMWINLLIIMAVTGVLLVFGTLAWWKIGDQWVSEEHKRFRKVDKKPDGTQIVVKRPVDDAP